MMRFLSFAGLLFCGFIPAFSQHQFVEHFPIEVYQGASQNWEFHQDKHGFVYIANNDGVLKYDGISWDMISHPNKEFIYSLEVDSLGKIYIGSYNEMGYFQIDSLGKYQYHSLTPKVPVEYRNDIKDVKLIEILDDAVCFMGFEHFFLYLNDSIKVVDLEGRGLIKLWNRQFLVSDKAFYQYNNGDLTLADFNKDIEDIELRWICEYEENTCLILDFKNQLWLLDLLAPAGSKLHLFAEDFTKSFPDLTFLKVYYTDTENIVLVSQSKIIFFNKNGKVLSTVSSDMFSNDFSLGSLYEDLQHNFWIFTNSRISQIISSSPFSYYDESHELNGTILSFGGIGQHQYVGTTKGIFYKENDASFTAIPEAAGETWNFYNYHGKLYVAHTTGVFVLEGKKLRRIIDHVFVHSLGEIKDKPDRLIMGTYSSGIWLLKREKTGWKKQKIEGFEEETRFIQEDEEGNIWVSHYNKGVYRLRLNEQMDSVTDLVLYNNKHGLPSHLNNRLYRLKSGKIIVTTVNGIYSYNYKHDLFEPEKEFNDVLGEGFCIYTLIEDAQNNIYFWGRKQNGPESTGALIRQPDGSLKLLLTPFNKISSSPRDLRIDVDAPLLSAGPDELWIGNNQRLISYNPSQKVFYDQPIKVLIKRVWLKDSLIFTNETNLLTKSLPSGSNNLKFEFICPFYERSDKNEYQYKLVGFEDGWSNWSTNHEAIFTNLPHGNYTLSVRAKNLYGKISEPDSYSFSIDPPWYKTWWAITLHGIVLFFILNGVIVLNNKRTEKQKLALEKKVDQKTIELRVKNEELLEKNEEIGKQAVELKKLNVTKDKLFSIISHDLKSPVQQIGEILNLIEKSYVSPEELKSLVPNLNENVRYTLSLMNNLLYWAKSQQTGLHVKRTVFDLQSVAEENFQLLKPLAENKNIHFINNIKTSHLVCADQDMIKLVLRNLVSNAIKFTNEGGKVLLDAEILQKEVSVCVKDTGIGMSSGEIATLFSKDHFSRYGTSGEKGTGIGLMLCLDFIEKNDGTIAIKSEQNKGSEFIFTIPKSE